MPEKKKDELPLRRVLVTADYPDMKRVRAYYKQSFSSAVRVPFRCLVNQPDEGRSELCVYIGKKGEINGLSYVFCKNEAFTYVPYITFPNPKKKEEQALQVLREALLGREAGLVVIDLVKAVSDEDKKRRQRKEAFLLSQGFANSGIVERVFGFDYEFLVRGGPLKKDRLDEYIENFWNSLEV